MNVIEMRRDRVRRRKVNGMAGGRKKDGAYGRTQQARRRSRRQAKRRRWRQWRPPMTASTNF